MSKKVKQEKKNEANAAPKAVESDSGGCIFSEVGYAIIISIITTLMIFGIAHLIHSYEDRREAYNDRVRYCISDHNASSNDPLREYVARKYCEEKYK